MLKNYKENHPDVEMDVHFLKSDEALQRIENGLLDICLCPVTNKHNENKTRSSLINVQAWKENLQVVAVRNHPLALKRSVTVAELARYPGILPKPYSAIRQSIDQLMTANAVTAEVAMEAIDFQTTRSMAVVGLGWAFLPISELDETLTRIDMRDLNLGYSVALVRNPDRSMSRAAKAFVTSLPAQLI